MNLTDFNTVVKNQMEKCLHLLVVKGAEYVKTGDRLAAFKKAGVLQDETPKQALLGMLAKHLVSIADMCVHDGGEPVARWEEKITDSLNYLLILRALVEEEAEDEAH